MFKGCIIFIFFSYISYLIYKPTRNVKIFVANSFLNWCSEFRYGIYQCKNRLICTITNNYSRNINFAIYNAWTRYVNYNFSIGQKKILWSVEKISWKKEMINIGLGTDKKYYGGIDYRLYYSPFHFSMTYFGTIKISLNKFISIAKNNINSLRSFMERKSIIYIQKINYSKRSSLVKEMMNYLKIDSYGKNLNNKNWPKGKSKIDLIKEYKFCLAIENSIETSNNGKFYSDDIDLDYSTEKLIDCLEGGSIPIYYGPKNSHMFLPNNNSAILMGKYENIMDIINYIKNIENSKEEISKYISWPITYSKLWYKRFSKDYKFSKCKLCEWGYKYK